MGAIVRIPDLVDLAVKYEDKVNPDLLRLALQSMVSHLSLRDMKVEFRGEDAKKIQDMVKNAKSETIRDIHIKMTPEVGVNTSKETIGKETSLNDSIRSGDVGLRKLVEGDDVVVIENGEAQELGRKRTVSFNSFSRLENKLKTVQAQIDALNVHVLPTDDALLQKTRSMQEATPISDMIQSLNITKRMSGAEEGLDKLASLLETVAKEYADLRQIIEHMQSELGENIPETMKQIKLAANYAKQIRPREELFEQYKIGKNDELLAATKSGSLPQENMGGLGVISNSSFTESTKKQSENISKVRSEMQQPIASDRSTISPKSRLNQSIGLAEFANSGLSGPQSAKHLTSDRFSSQKAAERLSLDSKRTDQYSVQDQSQQSIFSPKTITTTSVVSEKGVMGPFQIIQSEENTMFSDERGSPSSKRGQDIANSFLNVIPHLKPGEVVSAEQINKLLAQHEYIRKNMEYMTAQVNTLADFADHIVPEILAGMPHATELRKRIAELQKETKPSCPEGPEDTDDIIVTSKDLNERVESVEVRLIKHQAKLKRQDFMIAEKTMDLDNRIGKLTKSLADIVEVLGLKKHKLKSKDEDEMDHVFGKIGNIEEAVIEIGCATQNLLDDKEMKMTLLENLSEELKMLKSLKLDRFEIEDILGSKADCDELNKKVPLDKFDEAINDLAQDIDEAEQKMVSQESVFTEAMIAMQNRVDAKLDKAEIDDLREEIAGDLQRMKDELGKLKEMKEGRLAAGGKKKFVKDINCLSCDRNAAMATETGVPCIPAMADLTHMRSIRPFITYELEYLRKMKIKDPEVIKYIEYEELFRRYNLKSADSYTELSNVPHLKNRHCGGSHTVTGPQHKVPHTGHFDLKGDNSKNF